MIVAHFRIGKFPPNPTVGQRFPESGTPYWIYNTSGWVKMVNVATSETIPQSAVIQLVSDLTDIKQRLDNLEP